MIKTRRIKWKECAADMEQKRREKKKTEQISREIHSGLIANHEGKKSRGTPGCEWEDNIKRAFEEIRWKKFNWIHSVQDEKQRQPLMNALICLRFSYNF